MQRLESIPTAISTMTIAIINSDDNINIFGCTRDARNLLKYYFKAAFEAAFSN